MSSILFFPTYTILEENSSFSEKLPKKIYDKICKCGIILASKSKIFINISK